MRNVSPGDYDLVVGTAASADDSYVSAIRAGDEDAFSGIHVGSQPLGLLRIILKGNGGAVKVTVKDTDGKPQPNCPVEIVPDPPRHPQRALYSSCTTDAGGICAALGIAPGDYRVFAFPESRNIDLRNARELARIEDSGRPFKSGEGEKRSIEVNPIPDDQ
jgi:hypothetical protein